ncbi:MAG: prepilin-type N-terminal cleavage/methylation domain-containing protein [Verrucomicrobia bacterium]|nr:prepilin-type N-terminal cleavage/methylation domain-containing protein [Deltaproteobacteria bacterium]
MKHAFTLIELLVVIAIIAILAAILFPVFAQARDKARSATSISNVKQLALAHLMYTQDYDEQFVLCVEDTPLGDSARGIDYDVSWMQRIQPYTKNLGLFFSPNARNQDQPVVDPNAASRTSGGSITSYAMLPRWRLWSGVNPGAGSTWRTPFGNALMDGIGGYNSVDGARRFGSGGSTFCGTPTFNERIVESATQSQISRPAETALVFDSLMFEYGFTCRNVAPAPIDAADSNPPFGRLAFAGRYAFAGNVSAGGFTFPSGHGAVAFADGHVKNLRTETFFETFTTTSGRLAYRYQYSGE